MNYSFSSHHLRLLFVYGLAVSLPFNEPFTSINIIGIALTSVYWLFFNSKNKIDVSLLKLNIIPIIYIIGLVFNLAMDSEPREYSYAFLERSLSILILPLSLNFLTKENRNRIYQLFVGSVAISAIAGLAKGLFLAISNSDRKHFIQFAMGDKYGNKNYSFLDSTLHGGNWITGDHISLWLQTNYFSLYLVIAIIFILFVNKSTFFKNKTIDYIVIGILILTVFLLGSRSGILSLLIAGLVFLIKFIASNSNLKVKLTVALLISLLGFIIVQSPRFTQTINKVKELNFEISEDQNESMNLRIQTWKTSIDIIKDNYFFGISPRNTDRTFSRYYIKNSYVSPQKQNLNSHNQFFQVTIYWGIGGLALFIIYLLQPITLSNKSWVAIAFIIIIIINCLFESILERLQGIVILSYFWTILVHDQYNESNITSST